VIWQHARIHASEIVMRALAAALLFALPIAPAQAADWLHPDTAYSATGTRRAGNMEVSGPYAYDHGKERFEATRQGGRQILIRRPDLDVLYSIAADEGVGQISGLGATEFGMVPMTDQEVSLLEELGREVLDGEEVTKYELVQRSVKVWFWRTDDGIPLRIVGSGEGEKAYIQFEFRLTDLERGPQPAALFELPPGTRITVNPMAPQ
jgi:hypothetical protein